MLPTVTTAPSDTTVQLGSTATFTCVASGTPAPSISWVVGTRVVGQGNTLAVNNVAESDAAAYTCVATNDAGSVASPSARLVIFGKSTSILPCCPFHSICDDLFLCQTSFMWCKWS